MRLRTTRTFVLLAAALCLPSLASAQMLARPGWAGSGITTDAWWNQAVFYQIDPLSFQDSNGDGFGDLKGILARLDYIQSLGVDAILLSPLEPHPPAVTTAAGTTTAAHGEQVFDPTYGTNEDFDALVQQAAARKIRVLVDLPLSGAQTVDALTGVARFWLTRGVAGLRLVRDAGDQAAGVTALTPFQIADRVRALRALANGFAGQRILVGDLIAESPATPWSAAAVPASAPPAPAPAAPSRRGNRMRRGGTVASAQPDQPAYGPSDSQPQLQVDSHIALLPAMHAADLRQALTLATQPLHGPGPAPVLASDANGRTRSMDRYADGKNDLNIARMLAAVLLTAKTSTLLYFGQELGMTTGTAKPASGSSTESSPMQWGAKSPFTTGTPWLDSPASAATVNVEAEEADPQSLLRWYRQLSTMHHGNPVLRDGAMTILPTTNPDVVAWARRPLKGEALPVVVICNLSGAEVKLSMKEELAKAQLHGFFFRTLMRSGVDAIVAGPASVDAVTLPPYGTYIGELHLK
ncbi:alpha-amylase family glycosyl hydrolase [Granulicella rosea]|nr:alpha-amylase family glycosyl hydrolase [Granulicella rosea]